MRVALVGPPLSGKSTLFAAVAEAGGSSVHLDRPDQEHLAVVKVPDERLDWLDEHYRRGRKVPAEIELLDVPGMDLSDDAGRQRARAHWPAVRQADMIVFVLRAFEDDSVPPYRGRVDVEADLAELRDEMLFSDLEQVAARIGKLEASIRKPTGRRGEQARELELFKRLEATLEEERPIREAVANEAEEKLVRAFAFLTLKPAAAVVNCAEEQVPQDPRGPVGGCEAVQLSAKIEEELARLEEADRAEFMAELGISTSAGDLLIRSCYEAMKLVSFLTVGEKEVHAWTIPAGTDALTAAGSIHSDIARGFIRAEVVAFEDLRSAGDEKAAKAAGKYRLEGKSYVVRDGDVILFRFNV